MAHALPRAARAARDPRGRRVQELRARRRRLAHASAFADRRHADLPARLLRRLDAATRYYDDNGSCVYDDVVAAEREAGHRMVLERGRFAAFAPFASQSPFETWIVPTEHGSSLGNLSDDDMPALAETLTGVLGAIRRACGDPDYNFVVYSTEAEGRPSAVFCWHIKILPKLDARRVRAELGHEHQHRRARGRRPGAARVPRPSLTRGAGPGSAAAAAPG